MKNIRLKLQVKVAIKLRKKMEIARVILCTTALFCSFSNILAQKKNYQIRTIAFYNLENLFDTKNDSLTYDDDRTPDGKDNWTVERYQKKLNQIAQVISEIGFELTGASPDVIGLCEVENRDVLNDLVAQPALNDAQYGIVHFDSPDERGIDVALLYRKASFLPTDFQSRRLVLEDQGTYRDYTRDQLVVRGLLDDEEIHLIINHWPSRSGGTLRSAPKRMDAATLNRNIIDSILRLNFNSKVIAMGDFNDNPIDDSFKKILQTKASRKQEDTSFLYNPMEKMFKKGMGSLAYRDTWSLFDQIYFTSTFLDQDATNYRFWKAGIYNPSYLSINNGPYKGYPFRTYAGGNYSGGYSDHFPVFIYLIREKR